MKLISKLLDRKATAVKEPEKHYDENGQEMIPFSSEGKYLMEQILLTKNQIVETNSLLISLMNRCSEDDDDEPETPESRYAPEAPEMKNNPFDIKDVI